MPSQILVSAAQPKYWRMETPRDLPDAFRLNFTGPHVEASAAPLGVPGCVPSYTRLEPGTLHRGPWNHLRTSHVGLVAFEGWTRLVETDASGREI